MPLNGSGHQSALISRLHSRMFRAFQEPVVMSVRINVITCLIAMVASVLALGIPNGGVRAQDAGRIAAVVNDDAITLLDLYERTAIIFATTGLEDNQETRRRILPQVLRT